MFIIFDHGRFAWSLLPITNLLLAYCCDIFFFCFFFFKFQSMLCLMHNAISLSIGYFNRLWLYSEDSIVLKMHHRYLCSRPQPIFTGVCSFFCANDIYIWWYITMVYTIRRIFWIYTVYTCNNMRTIYYKLHTRMQRCITYNLKKNTNGNWKGGHFY